MDLDQIKQILDLVREHELAEFEIEHDGLRLKIRKDATTGTVLAVPAVVPGVQAVIMPPVVAGGPTSAPSAASAARCGCLRVATVH